MPKSCVVRMDIVRGITCIVINCIHSRVHSVMPCVFARAGCVSDWGVARVGAGVDTRACVVVVAVSPRRALRMASCNSFLISSELPGTVENAETNTTLALNLSLCVWIADHRSTFRTGLLAVCSPPPVHNPVVQL